MRVRRAGFKPWLPTDGDMQAGMRAYALGCKWRRSASYAWKAGWQKAHREAQAARKEAMRGAHD